MLRKHVSIVTILAAILGFRSLAVAQTSVIVEVRVLELSRADLEAIGGTLAKPGFAKPLMKSVADSLVAGPRTRVVHRIDVPATSETSTQVRLDSRIAVTSSISADVQTFFDAGIVMDVTPKVFQNRDISLATASQVRIRRGPDAAGTSLVVFENPSARFDTRIHEGEGIVLGGFITAAERMTLPDMPVLPDNPILNYLYPKARNPEDRTEIAILLTPRIVGMLINPAVDTPVIVSKPAFVNPTSPSLMPPITSPLAAASPVPISPQSAITSALPGASTASAVSAPVVTSPPTFASTTTLEVTPPVVSSTSVVALVASTPTASGATVAAVSRPPVVAPPPVVAGTSAAAVANPIELEGLGGKYTVQVGAFDQLEKAEMLRSQLAKKYEMVFVEKVSSDKTPYRVRVGRFAEMSAARQLEQKLIGDGFDTYVTTLN